MATANPTSYPLAGPQVSGDNITVSTLLAQPTRITRYLSDLSLRGFVSSRIFSTASGVSGGAVIYDQLTLNDLFPTRDVQSVGRDAGRSLPSAPTVRSNWAICPVDSSDSRTEFTVWWLTPVALACSRFDFSGCAFNCAAITCRFSSRDN